MRANAQTLIGLLQKLLQDQRVPADDVFQMQVAHRLTSMACQTEEFLRGQLTFSSTETWRSVYEDILRECDTKRYLSVALLRSDNYWQDAPGRSSIEFNYQLVADGFFIHRLFVIDDFLWPPAAKVPSRDIFAWIHEQHQKGIETSLMRISDIETESELVCDMGIYGQCAVGYQCADDIGRTVRFELRFDQNSIQLAEDRWKKLQLYARPIEKLLDH